MSRWHVTDISGANATVYDYDLCRVLPSGALEFKGPGVEYRAPGTWFDVIKEEGE